MGNDEPVVKNARLCTICQSLADRYANNFRCQKNPGHIADLLTGIFEDCTKIDMTSGLIFIPLDTYIKVFLAGIPDKPDYIRKQQVFPGGKCKFRRISYRDLLQKFKVWCVQKDFEKEQRMKENWDQLYNQFLSERGDTIFDSTAH